MTALLLGLVLLAGEPAPPPAAAATAVVQVDAAPPRSWWQSLPDNPLFTRALALGVVVVGAALWVTGMAALAGMVGLRVADRPAGWTESQHGNAVAAATLLMATGLILGAVMLLGGVMGLVLG